LVGVNKKRVTPNIGSSETHMAQNGEWMVISLSKEDKMISVWKLNKLLLNQFGLAKKSDG
jgi:hypothetical protein